MKKSAVSFVCLAGALLCAMPVLAQQDEVPLQTVVTIAPKSGEAPPIQQTDIKVWADGKETSITGWQPLHGESAGLELVVLIDNSARSSLGSQLGDLSKFIQNLPPGVKVGVAYMQTGSAIFEQNLTADHLAASKAVRLTSGTPGSNASPYFCLSDLAKRWPSRDARSRREVLMVTDGVDRYNLRYDPDNPYLQAAISDAQKAGILVYSIYFRDVGRIDRTQYETNAGQNLLTQLSQATGGKLYLQGMGNPVSFLPFLEDLSRQFENQYELGFLAKPKGKQQLVQLKIKTSRGHMEVNAPERVPVGTPQQ